MKNILCFGDSLTWGFNPENGTRFPFEQRWTGALQQQLGSEFRVIEEGLNGRTTHFEDPYNPGRKGSDVLAILLESHSPLDLVILFLGTNDLKDYTEGTAKAAALGCVRLVRIIQASLTNQTYSAAPNILLLSPPEIIKPINFMGVIFDESEKQSKKFFTYYQEIAKLFKLPILDTSEFLKPSPLDGVHLDAASNQLLGEKVASKVREILK